MAVAGERWVPDEAGSPLHSLPENIRVRALLRDEIERMVAADDRKVPLDKKFGTAYRAFAQRWWELANQLGWKKPGEPMRTPLAPGENPVKRQIDAGNTRIRQFLEGHNEGDWVLVGIESVINDRRGMALPPKAYQQQERLPGV